jgi:N-acetylmuramoyl-L-alanine amidase
MQRRTFIEKIFLLLSGMSLWPSQLFSRINQRAAVQQSDRLKLVSSIIRAETEIPVIHKWSIPYISVEDFAQSLHFGIYTNNEKKKTVLYIEKDRVTFTSDNTFVKFNDQILQIPVQCVWQFGEVWAPLSFFTHLLSRYTILNLTLDKSNETLHIEETDVNITGLRLAEKQNGTLIHVFSTRRFADKDIVLDIRNNYFHIDVYGGKIDSAQIGSVTGAGLISNVQGIQLGETASLVFKMKSKIVSHDLVFDDGSNNFYVNLRTDEALEIDERRAELKRELDEQKKRWMIDTIVVDAGHGGKDPGAIGYSKVQEKTLVLPIALKLGEIIQKNMPDVNVVYTRRKDVFIPLWKRTKIANDVDAKLFVSVHCNSNRSRNANGYETYFLSADKEERATDVVLKENSAVQYEESQDRKRYEGLTFILATMLQSVNVRRSQFLASLIQEKLENKLKKLGMVNRGVKQGPFWVLVGATMPNVLVESGYISNKHEEKLLKKSTTQRKIAEAVFEAIKKYKADVESTI